MRTESCEVLAKLAMADPMAVKPPTLATMGATFLATVVAVDSRTSTPGSSPPGGLSAVFVPRRLSPLRRVCSGGSRSGPDIPATALSGITTLLLLPIASPPKDQLSRYLSAVEVHDAHSGCFLQDAVVLAMVGQISLAVFVPVCRMVNSCPGWS